MKSKKVTMLAAALVVAVVAAAGIGYATSYTAKTTSTNDVAESAYIKVSQGGAGSYTGDWLTKVYFNTVNTKVNDEMTYTYELNKEWYISGNTITKDTAANNNLALISVDLSLAVVGTNSSDAALNLTVTTENLAPVTGLNYRMILVDDVTVDQSTHAITAIGTVLTNGNQTSTTDNGVTTWQFTGLSATTGSLSCYVLLFVEENSQATLADPGARAGFAASASFEFLVTADDV